MCDAIDRIVKASTLPLSIVIVGVGDADFSAMASCSCILLHCIFHHGFISKYMLIFSLVDFNLVV